MTSTHEAVDTPKTGNRLAQILRDHGNDIVSEWMKEQVAAKNGHALQGEAELRQQCREFLSLLQEATASGAAPDSARAEWANVREFLARVSRSRSEHGFNPTETATFIFSLKRPVFSRLQRELAKDGRVLFDVVWAATELLDKLGLFTTEVHQKTREQVIQRQQEEMLELSTPVVKLWEGILALPMIGTLDSNRTQIVMEALLQKIVETGSQVAIIDITGVPTVDTLVAQHLLKTVTAARLMGAECIISGVRPQIAQTIVHLGVDLGGVVTKATLADAFALALVRSDRKVVEIAKAH